MIKLACVGAGYFARFQVEAWKRIPEVEVIAICDRDTNKAQALAEEHGVGKIYASVEEMLDAEPDLMVLDVITPPETHLDLVKLAADRGLDVVCQKPLAPNLADAKALVEIARQAGIRLMVHENFRFQPWYRTIKLLLEAGSIGDQLHSLYFRLRMGDGWGPDAYLNRQPYFRTMPRLFVYETGIHFIDTFRYLLGEVEQVYARLRSLNPVIVGEDAGLLFLRFANGCEATLDFNRYNEPGEGDPRYTFGEMLLEGNEGSLRMALDGSLSLQALGEMPQPIPYSHENRNFAGDCVYFTQRHFVDAYVGKLPFETEGEAYLQNLIIQEAVYESQASGLPIRLDRS